MITVGIGLLAKRTGVPTDTVRHYERIGLVRPVAQLASGYCRYGDAELKRLRFIHRAKALGFTLDEIRELLTLSARQNVPSLRKAASARLADIKRRPEELTRIRGKPAPTRRHLPGPRPRRGLPDPQRAQAARRRATSGTVTETTNAAGLVTLPQGCRCPSLVAD